MYTALGVSGLSFVAITWVRCILMLTCNTDAAEALVGQCCHAQRHHFQQNQVSVFITLHRRDDDVDDAMTMTMIGDNDDDDDDDCDDDDDDDDGDDDDHDDDDGDDDDGDDDDHDDGGGDDGDDAGRREGG